MRIHSRHATSRTVSAFAIVASILLATAAHTQQPDPKSPRMQGVRAVRQILAASAESLEGVRWIFRAR